MWLSWLTVKESPFANQRKEYLFQLKDGAFDKSKIAGSVSAFTNDVGHIRSFGASTVSPFQTPPTTSSNKAPVIRSSKLMKPDGYTRSGPSFVFPTERPKTAPRTKLFALKPNQTVIIGHKQDTASSKDNVLTGESADPAPQRRFLTESSKQYKNKA